MKNKYIKNIIFIVSLLSFIFLVLIFLNESQDKLNHMDIDDKGTELIVILNEIPDDEDLHMLLSDCENQVSIVRQQEDFLLLSISEEASYQDIFNYLDKHPMVKSVEQDGRLELMQSTNDPYSSSQWTLHNPGYYTVVNANGSKEVLSTKDIDMNVYEAWTYMSQENQSRREVVVAIIDTGVDFTHPDLAEHIWVNYSEIPGDGIDNDNNGYVDDIFGWDFYNNDASVSHFKYDAVKKINVPLFEDNDNHGTHIAGIIGAVANNGIGIAGIASNINIKLMILKINGGPEGTGSISDAILAIKYATKMGARICNISWGTNQYSAALKEAISESDMLFVAAAGNSGKNNDSRPVYPASFKLDNLISVTFVDANGKLTRLSNYGKGSVEIAAPGTDILSTVVGSYNTLSGSSMAAPQVSGVVSLLYSYNKKLYPADVKNILIKSLKPIPELKNHIIYPGIPDAYKAVQEMINAKEDYLAPTIELDTVYEKDKIIIPVKVTDEGSSGIRVMKWLAGIRDITDFGRGTTGFLIEDNRINVSKAGLYTVYVSDYSGNENTQTYEAIDDTTAPKITYSYSVSNDYKSRDVKVKVTDKQSGVKRVKYLPGQKKASDFLPAGSGTVLDLEDGNYSFGVEKDGIYTVYAIDNRGNQIVKTIEVKTILSEDIKFTIKNKTLKVGEEYQIKTFVKPSNTTDIITYTSSDMSVVSVNSKGKITAHKEGTANITARTNSGQKTVCRIVVKPKS
jgi:subtilisin family serine protease